MPTLSCDALAALEMLASREDAFIAIDGTCPEWQAKAMIELLSAGYVSEQWHEERQYSAFLYRLTAEGKAATALT